MRKDISKVFVCEISLFGRFHHQFTHWRDHLLRFGGHLKEHLFGTLRCFGLASYRRHRAVLQPLEARQSVEVRPDLGVGQYYIWCSEMTLLWNGIKCHVQWH